MLLTLLRKKLSSYQSYLCLMSAVLSNQTALSHTQQEALARRKKDSEGTAGIRRWVEQTGSNAVMPDSLERSLIRQERRITTMEKYTDLSKSLSCVSKRAERYKEERDEVRGLLPWLVREVAMATFLLKATMCGEVLTAPDLGILGVSADDLRGGSAAETLTKLGEHVRTVLDQALGELAKGNQDIPDWSDTASACDPVDTAGVYQDILSELRDKDLL